MAAKAPKPWKLTEEESFASFTSWKHNLIYTLSRDDSCSPFLQQNVEWQKLTSGNPHRGFTDDADKDHGLTKLQKVAKLQQMLGLITQWVPHYLANDITNNSTSTRFAATLQTKYLTATLRELLKATTRVSSAGRT